MDKTVYEVWPFICLQAVLFWAILFTDSLPACLYFWNGNQCCRQWWERSKLPVTFYLHAWTNCLWVMTIYLPAGSFILPACLHFKSLQAAVEKVKTACDYICLQAVKWKKSKLPVTISACRQLIGKSQNCLWLYLPAGSLMLNYGF